MREATDDSSIDIALPATFGIIDLVQANAIIALDQFADKHEPNEYAKGHLYREGEKIFDEHRHYVQ